LETSFYNFSTGIAQFMWKNQRQPIEGHISYICMKSEILISQGSILTKEGQS